MLFDDKRLFPIMNINMCQHYSIDVNQDSRIRTIFQPLSDEDDDDDWLCASFRFDFVVSYR